MSLESESGGDFVLKRMSNMILRPRMYAGSPEEFDAVLSILDEIYAAYGKPKPAHAKYKTFVDFLREHGHNSNTFCSLQRRNNPDITNDELWLGITNAWKDYLSELIDHQGESGQHHSNAPV